MDINNEQKTEVRQQRTETKGVRYLVSEDFEVGMVKQRAEIVAHSVDKRQRSKDR